MGYQFTLYSTTRFETRPYAYQDPERMLTAMRLSRREDALYTLGPVMDSVTGQEVTEADLEALIAQKSDSVEPMTMPKKPVPQLPEPTDEEMTEADLELGALVLAAFFPDRWPVPATPHLDAWEKSLIEPSAPTPSPAQSTEPDWSEYDPELGKRLRLDWLQQNRPQEYQAYLDCLNTLPVVQDPLGLRQKQASTENSSEPATPQGNGMTLEQFLEKDRQALAKLREEYGPDAEP